MRALRTFMVGALNELGVMIGALSTGAILALFIGSPEQFHTWMTSTPFDEANAASIGAIKDVFWHSVFLGVFVGTVNTFGPILGFARKGADTEKQ